MTKGLTAREVDALRDPKRRMRKLADLVYRYTHRDFKGRLEDDTRTILMLVPSKGTCLVNLDSLSEAELLDRLPSAVRQQVPS